MNAVSLPDLPELRARYLAAQRSGDRREALRIVLDQGIGAGFSPRELSEHVIREAQREIGELWQRNEIGIADEHVATAISNLVLARLYDHATPAPRNGKCVLVACIEGELHELPARLVADALDSDGGFSGRYLGASVPEDSLLKPFLAAARAALAYPPGRSSPGSRQASRTSERRQAGTR